MSELTELTPEALADIKARDAHIHDSNRHTVSVAAKDRRRLLSHVEAMQQPCVWTPLSSDRWFKFSAGCGPVTMKDASSFCPYCGHKIVSP